MPDQPMKPYAIWMPDCQGKQDFDGPLLSVSTRYWPGPGGGGFMIVRSGASGLKIEEGLYGAQPSAHCSINLRLGPREPHDGGGDYLAWRQAEFKAPTEAEVKSRVEIWVAEQMAEIVRLLGGPSAFSDH